MAVQDCPYCDHKGKADSLVYANTNVATNCPYCIDGHIPNADDPETEPGLLQRLKNFFTT